VPNDFKANIIFRVAMFLNLEGVPLELLQQDFWVPNVTARSECARYNGKALFREILRSTGETCVLWIARLTKDPLYVLIPYEPTHVVLIPYELLAGFRAKGVQGIDQQVEGLVGRGVLYDQVL
jgi:hypothetical protein